MSNEAFGAYQFQSGGGLSQADIFADMFLVWLPVEGINDISD